MSHYGVLLVIPMAKEITQTPRGWRTEAARIVEELFSQTPSSQWDLLLELRSGLLTGQNWEKVLECFLHCRLLMEMDHYLPFYRLRKLLTNGLKLEAGRLNRPNLLDQLLRRKHRSLDTIRRALHREHFEHFTDIPLPEVRLVEQFRAVDS